MAKAIQCSAIYPGCTFVAYGEDETAVLINAAHHLTEKHDLREINQELLHKARAAMRETSAKAG
jgi:predicted small metal-binding protein